MSSQTLSQAVANVHDFGAYGDGIHDDSLAIQGAIDNADGKQVLFPEGVYLLAGDARDGGRTTNRASIEFGNDGQRATFLAGARLQLASAADFVRVSGADQAFVGMRIHRGDHGDALGVPPITIGHDPMLDVDGADRVAFRDLRVSSNVPAPTLVRLRSLTGCRFTGGRLLGDAGEGVGLRVGEAGDAGSVIRVSAIGLTIDQVGVGVRFDSTAEAVSFTGCRFGEITKTGIVLGPEEAQKSPVQVRSLTVSGCRFVQGEPKRWIRVRSSADVRGLTVSGCWFAGRSLSKASSKASSSAGATTGLVPARWCGRSPAPRPCRRAATCSPTGWTLRCRGARTPTASRSSPTPTRRSPSPRRRSKSSASALASAAPSRWPTPGPTRCPLRSPRVPVISPGTRRRCCPS